MTASAHRALVVAQHERRLDHVGQRGDLRLAEHELQEREDALTRCRIWRDRLVGIPHIVIIWRPPPHRRAAGGSDFPGNFRNRVFLRGVRFPREFLERFVRAKLCAAVCRVGFAV